MTRAAQIGARRRVATSIAAATVAVTLTGCGLADSVVGLHAVPTEQVGGAPLSQQTAADIATRVVAQAEAARAMTGSGGQQARKAVMAGSALAMADATAASRTKVLAPDPLLTPDVPQVLAIVKGRTWPRTILATTLDAADNTRYLQVLTSDTPTSRFVLTASVPMLSGSSVPAIGPVAEGVETVTSGAGLVAAPAEVLKEYAAALGFPKPAGTTDVAMDDALSTSLRSNAVAQAADLKKLATLTQTQKVVGAPVAFRLAGGGALVFGELTRTDTIEASSEAQKVRLPPTIAALVGRTSITRSVVLTSLETVVMVVPVSGSAGVIGADEQLDSAKGS